MLLKKLLWSGLGVAAVGVAALAIWLSSLPEASTGANLPYIPAPETRAAVEALKPSKRGRPVVAVVGINDATELTDYLVPAGILRRADVADVAVLSTEQGPVKLFPALTVIPDATIDQFDARYPAGADYVIVPAMSRDDDPRVLQWLRRQARQGATVIGICAGAKVVASAGLLDGKRATTHWYYVDALRDAHPAVNYVADRRLVVDRGVATTTGITASMPMMFTLIEAIAGKDKARDVAQDVGVMRWDARHDSSAFRFTRAFALTAIRNRMAFWQRERLGIALHTGMDEVSLALIADAWSRTYLSSAATFAPSAQPVATRHGLPIVPDHVSAQWPADRRIPLMDERRPAQALNRALAGISRRYGANTKDFVAMQLEYPDQRLTRGRE